MNQLSPQARRLLELARNADDPGNLDRARVGRLLATRVAAGGELASSPLAAKASAGKLFAASLKPALLALGIGGALGGAGYIASSRADAVASSPAGSSTVATMAMPGASAGAARAVTRGAATPTAASPEAATSTGALLESAPPGLAVADDAHPRPEPRPLAGMEDLGSKPDTAKRAASAERNQPARPREGASGTDDAKAASAPRDTGSDDSDVSHEAGTAPKVDPLRAEAEGLREAQRALRSGQAQKALDLLATQDARFASGLLAEERAAARVLSLCQAGLGERARLEAARFAARWPRSALLSRVQAGCLRE